MESSIKKRQPTVRLREQICIVDTFLVGREHERITNAEDRAMDGYVCNDSNIDLDWLKKVTFPPGAKVRPHPQVHSVLGEIAESFGGQLEVSRVVVNDETAIEYEFVGVDGRFNAAWVTDLRELEHVYGALVPREDSLWVVAFEGDLDEPVAVKVFRIEDEPEPYVRWNQAVSSVEELREWADGGAIGEFVMADNGDGGYSLVGIPWSSSLNSLEKEIAVSAVLEMATPFLKH